MSIEFYINADWRRGLPVPEGKSKKEADRWDLLQKTIKRHSTNEAERNNCLAICQRCWVINPHGCKEILKSLQNKIDLGYGYWSKNGDRFQATLTIFEEASRMKLESADRNRHMPIRYESSRSMLGSAGIGNNEPSSETAWILQCVDGELELSASERKHLSQIPFFEAIFAAMFTSLGRIFVRREAPEAAVSDERIAIAIAEEQNTADGCLVGDRKLAEKVVKASFRKEEIRLLLDMLTDKPVEATQSNFETAMRWGGFLLLDFAYFQKIQNIFWSMSVRFSDEIKEISSCWFEYLLLHITDDYLSTMSDLQIACTFQYFVTTNEICAFKLIEMINKLYDSSKNQIPLKLSQFLNRFPDKQLALKIKVIILDAPKDGCWVEEKTVHRQLLMAIVEGLNPALLKIIAKIPRESLKKANHYQSLLKQIVFFIELDIAIDNAMIEKILSAFQANSKVFLTTSCLELFDQLRDNVAIKLDAICAEKKMVSSDSSDFKLFRHLTNPQQGIQSSKTYILWSNLPNDAIVEQLNTKIRRELFGEDFLRYVQLHILAKQKFITKDNPANPVVLPPALVDTRSWDEFFIELQESAAMDDQSLLSELNERTDPQRSWEMRLEALRTSEETKDQVLYCELQMRRKIEKSWEDKYEQLLKSDNEVDKLFLTEFRKYEKLKVCISDDAKMLIKSAVLHKLNDEDLGILTNGAYLPVGLVNQQGEWVHCLYLQYDQTEDGDLLRAGKIHSYDPDKGYEGFLVDMVQEIANHLKLPVDFAGFHLVH